MFTFVVSILKPVDTNVLTDKLNQLYTPFCRSVILVETLQAYCPPL